LPPAQWLYVESPNQCETLARQVMEILEIGEADAEQRARRDAPAVSVQPAAVLPEGFASAARH
jgi:hypothetical protein